MINRFDLGHWYKTKAGRIVQFIRSISQDGMYNVFWDKDDDTAFYTDEHGATAYGDCIESLIDEQREKDIALCADFVVCILEFMDAEDNNIEYIKAAKRLRGE